MCNHVFREKAILNEANVSLNEENQTITTSNTESIVIPADKVEYVLNALSLLARHKVPLPSTLLSLRKYRKSLSNAPYELLNKSFSTSKFPDALHEAFEFPIFKTGA